MAGFMRLYCPLNIYDRWQWYIEPYEQCVIQKSKSNSPYLDDPIDGAYTYNDSRYITMKSDNQNYIFGLFIDIEHEGLDYKITLANIYRPPKINDNNTVLGEFNEEIRPIVTQLSQERSNCIITGDTNINVLKINERIKFQEYFDIFITNGLFPKIFFPTRYNLNRNTATLKDHLFCKFIDNDGKIVFHLEY